MNSCSDFSYLAAVRELVMPLLGVMCLRRWNYGYVFPEELMSIEIIDFDGHYGKFSLDSNPDFVYVKGPDGYEIERTAERGLASMAVH